MHIALVKWREGGGGVVEEQEKKGEGSICNEGGVGEKEGSDSNLPTPHVPPAGLQPWTLHGDANKRANSHIDERRLLDGQPQRSTHTRCRKALPPVRISKRASTNDLIKGAAPWGMRACVCVCDGPSAV